MGLRDWALRVLGADEPLNYESVIEDLKLINTQKDSHILTLESMLENKEKRHMQDMKEINTKLDFVVDAYKKQSIEMAAITKELLWQREEAITWRERLETKLALDLAKDGTSPPAKLIEIDRLRRKRNDKKGPAKT